MHYIRHSLEKTLLVEIIDKLPHNPYINAIPNQFILGLRRDVLRPGELGILLWPVFLRQEREKPQKFGGREVAKAQWA